MRVALLGLFLTACPPAPHVPPVGDAGPNPAGAVCTHLAALDCPEGKDPTCEVVTRRVMLSGLVRFDVPCVLSATTQDAVRACPAVRCRP